MAEPKDMGTINISRRRGETEQALQDFTALLIAANLKFLTGDATKVHETMEEIISHPKRVSGVLYLMLKNLEGITISFYPGGLVALCNYYIDQCQD